MYYVKLTPDMGRGVFANRDIKAGELICYCELLVLSEQDTRVLEKLTDLKYYTFKYNEKQDCLVLGDGEIFNHADEENVSYNLKTIVDSFGSRTLMEFRATKDCSKDTQLFINYSRDMEVNVDNYKINLVG